MTASTLPRAIFIPNPKVPAPEASTLLPANIIPNPRAAAPAASPSNSPRANLQAEPRGKPPKATNARPTRVPSKPNVAPSGAHDLPPANAGAKPRPAPPVAPSSRPTKSQPRPKATAPDASDSSATEHAQPIAKPPREGDGGGQSASENHRGIAPAGYLQLRIWSEMFEDLQKARIACANRVERGGVDSGPYLAQLQMAEASEHGTGLGMRRCYRLVVDPEIVAWQKTTRGVGEHLLARLLGVIGHPVYTTAHHWEEAGEDRELVDDGPMERSVSQLWSYCGHGDVTRKRRTGMSAEEAAAMGNPRAKMIVHLIAESVVKARGPHRVFYDERRLATVDREWTPGHSHNDALRILGKAFLKDLWLAAGDAEAGEGGQGCVETHFCCAPLALVQGGEQS